MKSTKENILESNGEKQAEILTEEALEKEANQNINEANSESFDGFDILQKHFPEFNTVEDLPKEVCGISRDEKISIFDAYLRYLVLQNKRIEAEQKNREKNSEIAVGSLKSADADSGQSYINAMLKAIRE